MIYKFSPNYKTVGKFNPTASIPQLEKEVGVYSASEDFVRANCGPLAISILNEVPKTYYDEAKQLGLYINIDIRIHRLYPGDFPAYPGWHCDGEFRETYFSQPNLDRIPVHNHLVATISSHSGGVSNTQFLSEHLELDIDNPTVDNTLWGQVHSRIMSKESIKTYDTSDGELVRFDSWTLHRCMPTKVRGWRLFFRMSMWHKPNLNGCGMISRQEQVYKLIEGSGW